jgi:hypothetical protein
MKFDLINIIVKLPPDEVERIDALCRQRFIPRSTLLRDIILQSLTKELGPLLSQEEQATDSTKAVA